MAVNTLVKVVVDRPRPRGPRVATALPSYPSGHTIQAVLTAVFVTAAVRELVPRRWVVAATGAVAGSLAALTGASRVVFAAHWLSDVVGGALLAGTIAAVALVAVHRPAGHPALLRLPEPLVWRAGRAGQVLTVGLVPLAAVVGAAALADEEAWGPWALQVGVLVVLGAGAVLARWRPAVGAVAMAGGGAAVALVASVRFAPVVALGASLAFLVPAFLVWLGWQHGQPVRSLAAVAVLGAVLLAGTWSLATAVYDAHPSEGALPAAVVAGGG